MVMREQDRHFLWSLLAALGIILVWKGLWEGWYYIPVIGNEWVALFVGFTILTFSGIIFKEFDPLGSLEKSVNKIANVVNNHHEKHQFGIKYKDKSQKKEILVSAKDLKHIEKGSLVMADKDNGQELFIPLHRLSEVTYKGKTYWRL